MSAPAWWEGLAAVHTAGPAGAEGHGLEWRDGQLHLSAHPDPDAEEAMAALGGEVCPCLSLLDAWAHSHATGDILVVGGRSPGERLSAPAAAVDAIAGDLARWHGALATLRADARAAGDGDVLDRLASRASPEEAAARRRLGALLLLGLDPRLQHRLQASVAAALAGAMAAGSATARAALTVATAARALPALRALGWAGDLAGIEVGDEASITSRRAVLPANWVAAVWGRALLDAVAGRLVVDVTSVTPDGPITVLAAAPGKAQVEIRVDRWENA